ncbi:serine/threonine-protein kinase mTOR-like [Anneissia japonica]|uniref:serine/threonine-protein kinase mTOR-like n=1 Tax=Anneissia japonica TaxID=1529436 RepID=UPI001425751A|nr:serine/threonine-protein kinase mTOR-like [Anneissia japonica]
MMQQFISGLKSRSDETRSKTAKNLQHYVTTELREVSAEEYNSFMTTLDHNIVQLVSSTDVNEKKGGVITIVSLIGIDGGNTTRLGRFANYLRNYTLPCNDVGVMEMASKAVGRLALAGGTFTPEYVEFEVRRALERLSEERHEARRLAAVLVLKELAINAPTFFFQQVQSFFDNIFNAVRDPKPAIREGAVAALRACLELTAQREIKEMQKPQWYKQTYEEAERGFQDMSAKEKGLTRDDKLHGSLLIINELIRHSSNDGERMRQEMEELSQHQSLQDINLREAGPIGLRSRNHPAGSMVHTFQPQYSLKPLSVIHPNSAQKPRFVQSRYCRELMEEKFDSVCNQVLKYRSSRTSQIQQTLLTVLPRLAAFQPQRFVSKYLEDTMAYFLSCLRKERERSSAFQALGLLAVAAKHNISQENIRKILDVIKSSLPHKDYTHNKKHKVVVVDPAVFTCISMLAKAVGTSISADIKELLEPMLAVGLSPALTASLHDLAHQIPHLKKDIQDGLLKMLSLVLMNKPLRHPGTPKGYTSPTLQTNTTNPPESFDSNSMVLALQTLGTFDFEGHSLTQFVRHCADQFLSIEHKEIRMEAARTCSRLLQPSIHFRGSRAPHAMSTTNTQVVADVLNKLLMVAITDTDSDIRYCVLSSLDERFDGHLAQAENLSALFVAKNDELFEIRELAMCMIGRLSNLNPAFVMPSLRKTLIQILTELEHSGVGRNKEQSARMLGHLVSNAPRLIRPYMEPIVKALIPKLTESDANPNVVINVLAAIGELSQVGGIEMRKWVGELLPIIIDMLQDSSSLNKREVALWTLGHLVESTGYVVEPYMKYPNLLDVLLNFLKTEQSPNIRRETIRTLGLLGALDPYKHKMNLGKMNQPGETSGAVLSLSDTKANQDGEYTTSEMLVSMGSASLEEFYPAVAVVTLMRIMRDTSLANYHKHVVQALTFLFKTLGVKCVQFLPQIMPTYLSVIRTCDSGIREFLLQQLGMMISIVRQHIRNYLDEIFALIKEFWTLNSFLQNTIIWLVEQIVIALGGEFKLYLPQIVPQMLKVFTHDNSQDRKVTKTLLGAMQKFGANLDDYLHLLLPPVVKLFDSHEVPMDVRSAALESIDLLSDTLDFTDFASRIIHPLVRTLDSTPQLQEPAMEALSSLVLQLGKKFQIFIPMVNKVLTKHKITHQTYDIYISKIIQGSTISEVEDLAVLRAQEQKGKRYKNQSNRGMEPVTIKKLPVSSSSLTKAFTATRRVSRDDWMEWLRRLSVELLKESPSHALRSCHDLAQQYNPLARDLFNAAFVSCWSELTEQDQDVLIHNLEKALTSQDIPEITQTLLNLAEFMEHCDKGPLPLDTTLLGERASKCRAYAKALHYKEEEFHKEAKPAILESLISIYNKLHQPEAAQGVLQYASKTLGSEMQRQETWYEKLHQWENALAECEKKQEQNLDDMELMLARMRCLEALGEWGQLHDIACTKWPEVSDDYRQRMACMAAAAAWGLNQWESMDEYACMIPRDTYDGAFYRAVLAVHQDHFAQAQQCINKARDILDTELTARAGESYNRAYGAMVNVQMLSELEEIIQYKLVPERQEVIKQIWWDRLQGCQRNVEDWQKMIQVRSLVISPTDDRRTRLKYASLCRKGGRMALSHKTLVKLMDVDPSLQPDMPLPTTDPHVTFAYMKHMWKDGDRVDAFNELHHFVQSAVQQYAATLTPAEDSLERREFQKLLARCYLKLGEWQQSLEGIRDNTIPQIISYYSAATDHDANWYKAWHSWAFMNYEAVLYYKNNQSAPSTPSQNIKEPELIPVDEAVETIEDVKEEVEEEGAGDSEDVGLEKGTGTPQNNNHYIETYAIPAVQGFFHSIALSSSNSLQDTLRLLTLWFDYGQCTDVYDALVKGIKSIQIDTWLQVIPQLIARIDTPRQLVGRLIHDLLTDIGKQHPQALIYPLTVASKSTSQARHSAADKILKNMCEHSSTLVHQAVMVSEELIRVAILWHELWHEGLEEASRLYFGERSVKGMFSVLEPLHAMIERGPQTMKETSFNQAYGRDLMEAQDWCRKYTRSRNVKDLTQAWDLYYHVFRRISKQLPQMTQLELQYVSPKLLMCRHLELAVPGTYDPNQPIIQIERVQSSLQVITSKQRPRKLSIFGSNGMEYMFLLKGHEDLRQDERVMQLFGLVNTLLANNPDTFRRHLDIQRYSIIPLSTNSGLIGWVPHCDTLHALIRDYRDKKKILLNIEHRIMLRVERNYRITCESVMDVLRAHKDSIMAVLEAFVYDPLLNWRLMDSTPKGKRSKSRTDAYSSSQAEISDELHGETPSQKKPTHPASSVQSYDGESGIQPEALNKKAVAIINRVRKKLTGRDFSAETTLDVKKQVEMLIEQATSHENLCQCYIGWCPFW